MAQNYTDSNRGVLRSVGGQDYSFVPTYLRPRNPISPTSASPDIKPKEQQGHYPVSSLWTNTVNQNVYVLAGIVNNLANWVLITSGGSGPMLMVGVPFGASPVTPDINGLLNFTSTLGTITITGSAGGVGAQNINFDLTGGSLGVDSFAVQATTAPGVSPVTPDGAGLVTFNGAAVANHSVPVETRSRALNAMNLEVQYSTSAAATDATKSGLAHFNSSQFSVDANGFVALSGGGQAIDQIAVDANTAPGTNPVLPSGAGQITVTGAQVAASIVGTNVIRTDSLAANTYTIEIQRSQAVATSTVADNGVSHFDSARFAVDANGFVTSTSAVLTNLGITNTAGTTFTVNAADGSALSSTNASNVTLQNLAVPGRLKNFTVTANQSFTQAQLGNNLFGLTSAVNITVDIPFYLYAVSNGNNGENTIAFMISRIPHAFTSPVAANIGQSGNTNATTQGSFFSLRTITAADYASSPCLCLGSFRMQYSSSLWTISTLLSRDGIGEFQDDIQFSFPRGQFGAASGKFFADNGGTAPNATGGGGSSGAYGYFIQKDGYLSATCVLTNTDVAGVGAVSAVQILPFSVDASNCGNGNFLAGGNFAIINPSVVAAPSNRLDQLVQVSNLGNGILTNANFGVGVSYAVQVYCPISRS